MPHVESPNGERSSADHVLAFLRRARLDWLMDHFPPRLVRSIYVFVNGFVTIGLLALVSRNPFVFPSLGPTAYVVLLATRKNVQPAQYDSWPCSRPDLRVRGVRRHRRPDGPICGARRHFLAANSRCGAVPLRYGRIHGFARREPSSRRCDDAHCFARHHFETTRARHSLKWRCFCWSLRH
jgi:hypothetical protein